MRYLAAILLSLTSLPAFAKWESCPSSCSPPATATGLSVRLPLYAGTVKFGGDAKGGMWIWLKPAPVTCSTAQLAERSDKVACAALIGTEMFRTPRVKQSARALRADAPNDPSVIPPTRATIPHCPMRLPDTSYTAEQREQCRLLDVLNGEMRGPE